MKLNGHPSDEGASKAGPVSSALVIVRKITLKGYLGVGDLAALIHAPLDPMKGHLSSGHSEQIGNYSGVPTVPWRLNAAPYFKYRASRLSERSIAVRALILDWPSGVVGPNPKPARPSGLGTTRG